MNFSFLNELVLSVVIGITQGITEFLPISSTAHLRLVSDLLIHRDIGLTTSNIIQFGTLVAIIQYFWKDLAIWGRHIVAIATNKNQAQQAVHNIRVWLSRKGEFTDPVTAEKDVTLAQILIATLPIIIFALLTRNTIENLRDNVRNIALFLFLGAIIIFLAEKLHAYVASKNLEKPELMTPKEVLIIGLFQCLSVFPGMSRSGSTLAGALALGRDRAKSVRFSFLISIPALGLASIYDLVKAIQEIRQGAITWLPTASTWNDSSVSISVLSLVIGFAIAYGVGLLCLKWLLTFLSVKDSTPFIYYRLVLTIVILLLTSISIL